MRILHISTNYKPVGDRIGHGGVELLVTWLARSQRALGHHIAIATVAGGEEIGAFDAFPADIQQIRQVSEEEYGSAMLRACRHLLSVVEHGGWDLIHDHMGAFAIFYAANHSKQPLPLVVSCYGQYRHPAYTSIYNQLNAVRKALPGTIITAAGVEHQRYLNPVVNTDFAIHAGVPEEKLAAEAHGDDFYLSLAIVKPEKQQFRLARLANELQMPFVFAGPILRTDKWSSRHADAFLREVRYEICLEDCSDSEIGSVVSSLSLKQGAIYVGEVFRPSVKTALFNHCRRFVLLNHTREAFSLAVLEALSRGLPVVAGAFPAAQEALQGFGTYVPALSSETITRQLLAKACHRDAIQRFCRQRYSISNWTTLLDCAYTEARHRAVAA